MTASRAIQPGRQGQARHLLGLLSVQSSLYAAGSKQVGAITTGSMSRFGGPGQRVDASTSRGHAPSDDRVAHVTAHRFEPPSELAVELRAELAAVRAELAALRQVQEQVAERETELSAARDQAERVARSLSEALADRVRIDQAGGGLGSTLSRVRQKSVTRQERTELEVLRGSSLWDPAWYLRTYPDVVELGEDPALHFLRHPYYPVRQPCPRFDIRQYLIDHPDAVEQRVNPLIHFLLTAESQGADAYPPPPR